MSKLWTHEEVCAAIRQVMADSAGLSLDASMVGYPDEVDKHKPLFLAVYPTEDERHEHPQATSMRQTAVIVTRLYQHDDKSDEVAGSSPYFRGWNQMLACGDALLQAIKNPVGTPVQGLPITLKTSILADPEGDQRSEIPPSYAMRWDVTFSRPLSPRSLPHS